MKISTRGRYAVRVMVDLAERCDCGYIPLKDIAERQGISHKYLESIMLDLSKSGLVDGCHGKGGGYRLSKSPEQYSVLDILEASEGDLAPVACLSEGAPVCERAAECRTLPVWTNFYKLSRDYFAGITLATLTH